MNKIIFILTFVCVIGMKGMESSKQEPQEIGFGSAHYRDFLTCYFGSKATPEARATYLNYCMRDQLWSLYKKFLEDGGTRVIDMAEKPVTSSVDQFQFARAKVEALSAQVGEACKTLERLEVEHQRILEREAHKKSKKKKHKGDKG